MTLHSVQCSTSCLTTHWEVFVTLSHLGFKALNVDVTSYTELYWSGVQLQRGIRRDGNTCGVLDGHDATELNRVGRVLMVDRAEGGGGEEHLRESFQLFAMGIES